MTSDTDFKGLREIAEKVPPGDWRVDHTGDIVATLEGGAVIDLAHLNPFAELLPSAEADIATFIATFNPETVKALLSAAEEAERAKTEAQRLCGKFVLDASRQLNERDFLLALALACCDESFNLARIRNRQRLWWADQCDTRDAALQAAETRAQQAEARVERDRRALEFARYLADAADAYLDFMGSQESMIDHDARADLFKGLRSASYEFRKRAARQALGASDDR